MGILYDGDVALLARLPWLTVAQCAVYLSKSEDAIRGLLKRGIIPPKRLGKSIYIDRRVLDEQISHSGGTRRLRRMRE
jgi:hypothetical protein